MPDRARARHDAGAPSDKAEAQALASADTPRGRNAQFAVLFRQAIEAHEAETGRGSTAGDRAAIKDKLRADRPDLAWWDNLTAESTVS